MGGAMVFSFDYAQNLTLPQSPEIPSSFYFMSLLNVSCFGVVTEGAGSQTNYLYDESVIGKGLNKVISLVALALQAQAIGKTRHLILYADNCSGRNKNYLVIQYLALCT